MVSSLIEKSAKEVAASFCVKQMLKSRIFVGNYIERRHVDSLNVYRDVIVLGQGESDIIKDLKIVRTKLLDIYPHSWIGITSETVGAPAECYLWVDLRKRPAGKYWFQIKNVQFYPDEVLLELKVLKRTVSEDMDEVSSSSSSQTNGQSSESSIPRRNISQDSGEASTDGSTQPNQQSTDTSLENVFSGWEEYLTSVKKSLSDNLLLFLSVLTLRNTSEFLKGMIVLLATIMTGLINLLRYLLDFSIKFMREINGLVRAFTPIFLEIINFFSKTVGGFYLLIGMMWKGKGPQPQPNLYPRAIQLEGYPIKQPRRQFSNSRSNMQWT